MSSLARFKQRVRELRSETFALYLAARHPATPWYAKLLVAGFVAYAFSPIDLIPDFIPILGYVDELIVIPLGVALALRLIPPEVMAECRARAAQMMMDGKLVSRVAAVVIIAIWVGVTALCAFWAYEGFAQNPNG
jgi:uncharacterized membrane protein YkvA (DUF1232 family)